MNPIVSPGITCEGLYDVGIELLRRLTVQDLGLTGSYGAGVIWSGNGPHHDDCPCREGEALGFKF